MTAKILNTSNYYNVDPPTTHKPTPFWQFLCKVHSRCNLDCDYCYMYQFADQSWRSQPPVMSSEVIRQTAIRIREHALAYQLKHVDVILHGGEPLLIGEDRLKDFILTMEQIIGGAVKLSFGIQSNGTLLSPSIINFCYDHNTTISISLDGPKWVNDLHRLDHRGESSYSGVEQGLNLLLSTEKGRKVFVGILCTICLDANPLDIVSHLASFDPPSIDFSYPLGNYLTLPPGKSSQDNRTPYADWLIPIFDHWYDMRPAKFRIRKFQDIMALLLGGKSAVEDFGLAPVDFIVVETNGGIEGVDSLKTTFADATKLTLNVFDNSFEDALYHPAIVIRQIGQAGLCETCQNCHLVEICGGGHMARRYHPVTGFMNPDIYCLDHQKLIGYIRNRLMQDLQVVALESATSEI